jgi:hypothetical protein
MLGENSTYECRLCRIPDCERDKDRKQTYTTVSQADTAVCYYGKRNGM